MSNPLETGFAAWCPAQFCQKLGKRVKLAFDIEGRPVGRTNVPTFICANGHGWTIGQEEDARAVFSAIEFGGVCSTPRPRRPLIVVP